jgi:hypothetical protein
VRQAVEHELRSTLSPLPPAGTSPAVSLLPVFTREASDEPHGWPLRKAVLAVELKAVVSRVPGVAAVHELYVAGETDTTNQDSVEMRGLELPRIAGLMVTVGTPVSIADLRGARGTGGPGTGTVGFVPIPVVPEEC